MSDLEQKVDLKKYLQSNLNKKIYDRLKDLGLRPRGIVFCIEFLNSGFNITEAYRHIATEEEKKYSPNTFRFTASAFSKKPEIKEGIGILIEEYLSDKKLTLEKEIVDVLYKRAFYDPALFLDTNGEFRHNNLDDIPKEWRCVIDNIETKHYGKDGGISRVTVKLANRDVALDKLAKWLHMLDEKINVSFTLPEESERRMRKIFNEVTLIE